jgi:porin
LADEGLRPAGAEMVLETTYQIQINPWLILQPDLQYIIQPSATNSIGNAFLVGFRANVTF